ncbi:MAG: ATP-dependent zinc metalloprotease FtsH [Candidatus Palauibacterales bacterium]|nr:ATP-dependent zinc metalloprotease FtsH [Candidatus Palauibacterales bacterium]
MEPDLGLQHRSSSNRPQEPRDEDSDSGPELPGGPSGSAKRRSLLIWLLIALALASWFWSPLGGQDEGTRISYTTFREQVTSGNVAQITVSGQEIRGELNNQIQKTTAEGQTRDVTQFVTYLPSFGDEQLLDELRSQGVVVNTEPPSDFSWWEIALNLLPFLLLIWLGYLFISRMRGQGQNIFSMGKSQARLYDREEERTTFDDVAGAKGAKTELQEVVKFLKDPDRFEKLGGEIPRGVLMVGPPGTGKTLLARAVAGEAEVPFYSVTGSDFMEMLVGVGASRVRDLFEEAKKSSPAIVFIDELDSIGRQRGAGLGGGHDEREQTLNQLLSEMDGFEPNESVIVMAATNRPDILDPALLRPGRFDRQITVALPTMKNREKILEIHASEKPLADDVDLEEVARGTPGFSGADLRNLLNEAALLAARKEKKQIEAEDVDEARDKVLMGLEREVPSIEDEEVRMLAYHESGHAVLAALLPHSDPIHKVTIIPRGKAMGVTQQLPEREKYIYPKEYMEDRLAVMMGGRAAEDLIFDTATSGAANDLQQATKMARKMVLDFGMAEGLENIALGDGDEHVFLGEELARGKQYSDGTAREVDEAVKNILREAFRRAKETLQENRDGLDRLAETLIEKEELAGDEVVRLLGLEPEEARPEGEQESGEEDTDGDGEAEGTGADVAAAADESEDGEGPKAEDEVRSDGDTAAATDAGDEGTDETDTAPAGAGPEEKDSQ